MNRHSAASLDRFVQALLLCHKTTVPLPGVQDSQRLGVFVKQLIDSIRRVQYVSAICQRDIDPARLDGSSAMFDPLRAAALWRNRGDLDEACWLTFLFVHFGKHPISGYRYTREVYSALGHGAPWTFKSVSEGVAGMRRWLDASEDYLRRGTKRGFGNHRKYQSLSGSAKGGTGDAFASYVEWVGAFGSHAALFRNAVERSDGTPEGAFEWLYSSMGSVVSFGRIGKFDYLTMLQKLGLAHVRPGRPYFDSTTAGPNKGARLLFQGADRLAIGELEQRTISVGAFLGVGMQEMEDALCNWGKNPVGYRYFRG